MKGSCLCGVIEYEIDSIDMPITHCHCQTCRKAHAAPFASTAGVTREHFRWLKGSEKLSAFESSQGKLRYFCSVCGSHLMAERENLPHVIVRVATLDEDPHVIPQQHIWIAHDVPWLNYENLPAYQEWQHPLVTAKASEFVNGCQNDKAITKRCFEFVRDEIKNSWD